MTALRNARRRARQGWVAVLLLHLLAGCTDDGILRGSVVLEGDHELGAGAGHVLILAGTAGVPQGATVEGTVVLLGDGLSVDGRIAGDLMLLDGGARLGPTAVIDGTMVIAGATVTREAGSVVRGGVRTDLDVLAELARPAPTLAERAVTIGIQAVLLAAFAWLISRTASAPLERIADAATRHVAVSGAMGVLAGLVTVVLLVVMAFTVVLVPVSLVLALAAFLAVAVGWTGFGRALAGAVAHRRGGSVVRPAHVVLGTLAVAGMLTVLAAIPVVGSIAALLVTVAGFGAVLITGFGMRRFVPDSGPVDDGPGVERTA